MTSLLDVVGETERRLVEGLALTPLPLDPALARATGTWKGRATVVETTAWTGPAVAYARFARVWQPDAPVGEGLEIGNVLALGHAHLGLPILGADLLRLGARAGMVVADLSPSLPPGEARDRQLVPLMEAAARRPPMTPGGELPEWCARFFSPHALFVRPEPHEMPDALAAFRAVAHLFDRLAGARSDAGSQPPGSLVHGPCFFHRDYLSAHRTDDRGLGMLARIFGGGWASRYVERVLFPEQLPGCPAGS